ncbi:TIGR04222 domain-containing membrane protein [Pseudonocardia acaciae]|uniref:TIGR04222 domain-containing membrane protein n=1 Tax=Pseudonocardia acaciae TaxID=551276 RepID=UPI00048A53F1|nr:TIGR04222 domain-containing membrane protein [Pseudonocardia acaciae]
MTHLAAAPTQGDTWGLSGPTFLLFYLALAGFIMIAALAARRTMRTRRAPAYGTHVLETEGDGPYLAAYLNGGPKLAMIAALSSLRVAGLVRGRDHRCERVGTPTSGWLPRLERAILDEAGSSPKVTRLVRREPVAAALDALRDELVRRRLLVSDRDRAAFRRWHWAMVAVFALGVVRLMAGASDGKPIGYLVLSLLLVGVLTVLLRAIPPRRTVLGETELARLRSEHRHLSPSMRPDWTANGAMAAALAVGAFGAGALWTADPSFADEVVGAKAGVGFGSSPSTWSGGSSGCGSSGGSSCGGGGGGGCGGGGGGGGGCGG